MSFLSMDYLAFIGILVILFYIIPQKFRYLCILAANIFFYMSADAKAIATLAIAILLTYIGGWAIYRNSKWFWLFFLLNISILLFYKYVDFGFDNLNLIRVNLGLSEWKVTWNLMAPLGLSFYIFTSTTYMGDIKNHKLEPEKNVLKYATFVSFFPTILSGPIQKARNLLPQLLQNVKFSYDNIAKGTMLIIWGWFEKLLVSNNLAIIVNKVFDNYEKYHGAYYLVAAVCFSLQIYSDFAAYSDIARGTAKLFGINVGKNFDNPYLSTNLVDFWKRWHISLNQWFVEYVYIPLGGSKKGRLRQYINTMVVFLISGLWHGASFNYIAWGG